MRLEGCIISGNRRIGILSIELEPEQSGGPPFSKRLDTALLSLCKEMNVPLPIWLSKNTREFAHFHQTCFFPEQFAEECHFDRFSIRLYDENQGS